MSAVCGAGSVLVKFSASVLRPTDPVPLTVTVDAAPPAINNDDHSGGAKDAAAQVAEDRSPRIPIRG